MKNASLYFLFLFLVLTSCRDRNPYHCKIDQSILSKNDSIIEHQNAYYDAFLKRTGEPDLRTVPNDSYRLIVYYAFERDYWIYRLTGTGNGGLLTIKKTYQEAYKAHSDVHDTIISRKISRKQWDKIERVINSNCFWTMPVDDYVHGFDGRSFILEAVDPIVSNPSGRSYMVVGRWEPEKNTGFKAICDAIESLDQTKEK